MTYRQHWYMLKSTKIYLSMYYVSLIWSVISCMLSKHEFFFFPIWTSLNQMWSWLRVQDIGYDIVPQTKATFWLFPPLVKVSSPITCLFVTQSVPVGSGSRAKASVGAAEHRGWCHSCVPGLLWGSMGSAVCWGHSSSSGFWRALFQESLET